VPENHDSAMRVEVVLRSAETNDDVLFHNKRLRIGEVIQTDSGSWRVIAEESPTHIGIQARYICLTA
jgi:hypothetical protein